MQKMQCQGISVDTKSRIIYNVRRSVYENWNVNMVQFRVRSVDKTSMACQLFFLKY